ncbi:hypothetical protein NMQ14_04395 [Methyloversatilis sp. XJ19-13]|nr:hypothetical protein [Methyloversatilis sp. XJ19-13]MCQ9373481.1 hypothetical protein [Methyloversatilis sp. XJ19-13]
MVCFLRVLTANRAADDPAAASSPGGRDDNPAREQTHTSALVPMAVGFK